MSRTTLVASRQEVGETEVGGFKGPKGKDKKVSLESNNILKAGSIRKKRRQGTGRMARQKQKKGIKSFAYCSTMRWELKS